MFRTVLLFLAYLSLPSDWRIRKTHLFFMETIVNIGILALGAYLLLGLLFAVPFLWKGAAQIDEGVSGTTRSFSFIILPGIVLLWPILLLKWLKSRRI